jgi:hypothetical protein
MNPCVRPSNVCNKQCASCPKKCYLEELYESKDVALQFAAIGSTCTTPAAIRNREREGQMSPSFRTVRGGRLWTHEALCEELKREKDRMRRGLFRIVPKPPPEPRQLTLRLEAV